MDRRSLKPIAEESIKLEIHHLVKRGWITPNASREIPVMWQWIWFGEETEVPERLCLWAPDR
jgi:hypothetical protein